MNVREQPAEAPVRRGRGRPPLGDKRRQILDAALVLFAERGYHGTAVPLVASAAHVGTGTIYHYFTNKEELVNAVFRDAKTRLRDALFDGLDTARDSHALFLDVWDRLARFAKSEPLCFRFLEMQDHIPYLDEESLALERKILVPLWVASSAIVGQRDLPAEIMMALVWGALVGLVKSERLGYLSLTEDALQKAGEACWQGITAKLSN
jgi:AcrR family transcriptional regulator